MDKTEFYRLLVKEYQMQTRLNWQRARFFLTASIWLLILGIVLTALTSFLEQANLFFTLGAIIALIGCEIVKKGHEYHRAIAIKKAEAESKMMDQFIMPYSINDEITKIIVNLYILILVFNIFGVIYNGILMVFK